MRQVPGQPEQLQLERERERVERGPNRRETRRRVEQIEKPRECAERALVGLLLDEQAQHRLGADQPDVESIRVIANELMRRDQLDASHRLELPASLVEQELYVAQRLEPRPEP